MTETAPQMVSLSVGEIEAAVTRFITHKSPFPTDRTDPDYRVGVMYAIIWRILWNNPQAVAAFKEMLS